MADPKGDVPVTEYRMTLAEARQALRRAALRPFWFWLGVNVFAAVFYNFMQAPEPLRFALNCIPGPLVFSALWFTFAWPKALERVEVVMAKLRREVRLQNLRGEG